MFLQQTENGLNLQFKIMLDHIEVSSKVDLFQKINLARDNITNKESLKNIISGKLT